MSISSNKDLARAFVQALIDKRRDDVRKLVSPDATWWISGSLPFSGSHSVEEIFSGSNELFADAVSPFTGGIGSIIADKEMVSIESWGRVELASGQVYHNEANLLIQIDNGMIISIKEYGDTDLLRRLFCK